MAIKDFFLRSKLYVITSFLFLGTYTVSAQQEIEIPISQRVSALMAKMTLEEKIGQMNQYNGFWNVTGPSPKDGNAKEKYDHLAKGWVGSMLNVRGAEEVRAVQKVAVEESRLGIPLIIGFDLIHGYKTISPIPLAESASWDLAAIKIRQLSVQKKLLRQGLIGPLLQWLISQGMLGGEE